MTPIAACRLTAPKEYKVGDVADFQIKNVSTSLDGSWKDEIPPHTD